MFKCYYFKDILNTYYNMITCDISAFQHFYYYTIRYVQYGWLYNFGFIYLKDNLFYKYKKQNITYKLNSKVKIINKKTMIKQCYGYNL